MDHKNFGQLNVKPLVDDLVQKIDDAATRLQNEGREAGEAVGLGWESGFEDTVEKIKASSIKTNKAFSNLSEKIRKQVQQLSATLNGKDVKFKIDFSDIDMNSDDIKNRINKILKDFSTAELIEFDAKGSEQQFKNLIALYVKYQAKLQSLQQAAPSLSGSDDIIKNLQQQLALSTQLKEIWRFLDTAWPLTEHGNIMKITSELETAQKLANQIRGGKSDSFGNYDKLAEVLQEIQGSLKIISDVFQNEKNSMKEMADSGKTSFESLSQAIIGVYTNLTEVQALVDEISQKDFNITNITNPASNATSKRQGVKQLKAEVEAEMQHVKALFQESDKLLNELKRNGMTGEAWRVLGEIGGVDEATHLPIPMSYADFEKDILDSMADAKTKAKIENLLVVIDGYISKLTAVNKLREEFGLGAWADPLVQSEAPTESVNALKQEADAQKNLNEAKKAEPTDVGADSETQKLRELVNVITNEVSIALDSIKEKFEQSFVVPELDKNKLQASFDEIYNKFVELKDKIQTMQIDISINGNNLAVAIQEALYAKEIAAHYKEVEFEDVFESDFDKGTWMNLFTGEIFDTFDAVDEEFDRAFKGLFTSKNGFFLGTKEDMLADLLSKQSVDNTAEQENWAQVIVEAINTQGGNIVEAIKVMLPQTPSSDIDDENNSIDEAKLSEAFRLLSQAVVSWSADTGKSSGAFFRSLQAGRQDLVDIHSLGDGVEEALRTLGLISEMGKPTFVMPDTGMRNLGVVIADQIVGNVQDASVLSNASELQAKLDQAAQLGAAVPRILALEKGVTHSNGWVDDVVFQLQTRVPGENIESATANKDFLGASPEQIDRLIHTFETLYKVGLFPDFIGENVMFDKDKGFSLVDLDTTPLGGVRDPDDMIDAFLKTAFRANGMSASKELTDFSKLVRSRFALPPEKRLVNADTIAAEQVARQNDVETKSTDVKLRPTMDEGAVAKVVAENVAKTPATVKVTPVVDGEKTTSKPIDEVSAWVDKYFNFVKNEWRNLSFDEEADAWNKLFAEMPAIEKLELDGKMSFSSGSSINKVLDDIISPEELAQQIRDNLPKDTIVESALESQRSVDVESQSAVDAARSFVDAANAKKQFVEANKQVAESAKESAKAVEEEAKAAEQTKQTMTAIADDTIQPSNWDKITQLQTDHGEDPFALSRSKTDNVGDKSVRTIVESWTAIRDEDGALTGDMELNTVKIINDFKKRTDAITKENEKIKTAQAYLQKFLTQFNNKTMGKGSLLAGYQDLVNLANSSNFKIDDIARAEQMMSNLDAEYNKVVQSMRKGSASMNPFVNAINSMDKMEDVLLNISLQFRTLNQQPEWLKNQIIDLYKQVDNITAETDIYKFAEGFGNLRVSINSVTESIRQQRLEQKLTLSDFNALTKAIKARDDNNIKAAKQEKGSDWEKYYLDRAAEQQKIVDAIRIGLTLTNEQEAQLEAMSEKHALILKDISLKNNKIEEQKQKYEEIMRLLEKNHADQIGLDSGSLRVVDKDAYQQRLNAERAQIDALIKGADLHPQQTKSVKDLVDLIATLKLESSNIDLMSKKWAEQNLVTDKVRAKIEALKQVLRAVTSGSELNLWKKQWKELANEMSMANIDAKENKQIGGLIEDDRKAQVKEYIDLLKMMHDYERRATKEDQGSKMQTFYNAQFAKVKERIDKIDIKSLENQDEKNRRLALEEAQQRAISEILEEKNVREQRAIRLTSEEEKIQKKYEAGYLSEDLYNDWQKELTEYRNYMAGITQADDATIQKKKKSLMQLYDILTKMSNASKSFFASGGEILPQEMWLDKTQLNDVSGALQNLYQNIVAERFVGMQTSVTGVNDKLGKLTFTVDDGAGSLTQYTIAMDSATGATKLLQNTTKPTLTVLQKLGQTLKKDFTGLLTSIVGGSGIHAFVQYMRKGIQSVRELDLALTELKKVTDETEETYDRFLETAAKTGERIGSTISNVTSATAEFAKLGYNIEQAASMAEAALVYTNVGDNIDVETGSQSIISTLKAFGIEAKDTMSIVDKFNEVGKLIALR